MKKDQQTSEFYEFGSYRLDVKKHRLWRGEELISLTPKEFELLLTLVENAGKVVEKDDLLDKIWKDTFVEEGTLTRNVSWLRKKLGTGEESGEKFIETLPKRGYRFLPEVIKIPNEHALVVEEQTFQHIVIEETISVEDSESSKPAQPVALLPEAKTKQRNNWILVFVFLGVAASAAIFYIIYKNYFFKSEPHVVLISHVVPFSGLAGRESMPSFSPDGKQIAFAWNGGDRENLDIYIKLIGAGEPVRLTKSESDALGPVFSPDGKHIAFFRSSSTGTKIYMIPALGGAERKICDVFSGGTTFSWSPDGKTIAVADKDLGSSISSIVFVNVETGDKQKFTTSPENFRDHTPRFSPDGKTLVFIRSQNKEQDLFVAPVIDGSQPRRLTSDKTIISGLAWSADSKRIIFASMRGQSLSNLWQISAAGGEPQLIMAGGKNPLAPAVSPDGKLIAYVEMSNDTNIWRYEIDDTKKQTPSRKFIASSRTDHSPQVSPDNNKIVFVSDRTGDSGVWISNADGSNPMQLAALGGSPRFSPDGKFIVYGTYFEGNDELFIISEEGGAPRRLTNSSSKDHLPSWSADGKWIYFCSNRGGDFQLWKMPSDGNGEAVQITKQGGYESFAAPDGKTIYYSKGNTVAGLWQIGINGENETQIPELTGAGFWRYWTVTSNGIYYVARTDQPPYQIMFYDFSNKRTKEIATTDKPPLWDFSGLTVFSDGKAFLYAQHDQNASSIMLAELPQ